jgi:hypothetical protein
MDLRRGEESEQTAIQRAGDAPIGKIAPSSYGRANIADGDSKAYKCVNSSTRADFFETMKTRQCFENTHEREKFWLYKDECVHVCSLSF